MRNIAYSATVLDIKIALANKLHQPPFSTDPPINFHVNLFFKRKGCGTFTLPSEEIGNTFMLTHGSIGISVKNRTIYFAISTHAVDMGRVSHLLSTPWEDPSSIQMKKEQDKQHSLPMNVKDFSFGRFRQDDLFIAATSQSEQRASISCDIPNRRLVLRIENADNRTTFDREATFQTLVGNLFLGSISDWFHEVAAYTPSWIKSIFSIDEIHGVPRVFIRSNTPPIFTSEGILEMPHQRRSCLRNTPILPKGYSLCLTFSSMEDREIFLGRCRYLSLPVPIIRDRIEYRLHVNSQQQLNQIDQLMGQLQFPLAFEIEKALANGQLEPIEILPLERSLDRLSSDTRVDAATVFKGFLENIQQLGAAAGNRRRRRNRNGRNRQPTPREWIEQSLIHQLDYAIGAYPELVQQRSNSSRLPTVSVPTYHLSLTPTSQYPEGPLPDQSNSVLRRFGHHECFLRVSIQDEHKSKLRRDAKFDYKDLLRERFRPIFTNGFRFAGRKYDFLGYSMSGLREHNVWFVCPFTSETGDSVNAASIRDTLV